VAVAVRYRHIQRRGRAYSRRAVGGSIEHRWVQRRVDDDVERRARGPAPIGADDGAVDAVTRIVVDAGPAAFIQAPTPQQARRRENLTRHPVGDLLPGARDVPYA